MNCGRAGCVMQSCSQSTPWLTWVRRKCVSRRWLNLRTGTAAWLDERDVAIVMVTHDADVARQTDRIIHIRDGKVDGLSPSAPFGPTACPETIP